MTQENAAHGSKTPYRKTMRRFVWWMLMAGVVGSLGIGGWWWFSRPSDALLLKQARLAFARREFERSARLAERLLTRSPDSFLALLLAARSAGRLGQYERAISYYDRIPDDRRDLSTKARNEAGDILLAELHRASAAEMRFQQVLSRDPGNIHALNRLAHLYTLEGRGREALEMLMRQLRRGAFTVDHLILLAVREGFIEQPADVEAFLKGDPADALPLIGRARQAVIHNRNRDAVRTLRTVLAHAPEQVEAWALLGRAVLELGDDKEFFNWQQSLPDSADEHPQVWAVRGLWCRRNNRILSAIRCFRESVRLDPNQRSTNLQLGQTLIAAEHSRDAAPFLQRAELLDQLDGLVHRVHSDRRDVRTMQGIAERMESLGRIWEAWAWCRIALSIDGTLRWARAGAVRLGPRLKPETPWTLASELPGRNIDWSMFPRPDWVRLARNVDRPSLAFAGDCRVRFIDEAAAIGLRFQYHAGHQPGTEGKRMYEELGGGVAILDYDNDGRPDVYLTQGSRWPPNPRQTKFLDRLYSYKGQRRLEDVAENAGLKENGYSQGITVGDYNGDGFADLYVANIGSNRFYRNNGDGTFSDITIPTNTGGKQWTSSCLLADLNGDALPDLYCVNYLAGDDVFDRLCKTPTDRLRVCSPALFDAAGDRVYLNLGNGRFQDVTSSAGIGVPNGKGLGIIAADFDASRRLSLFVANDQTANFFFRNRAAARGSALSFDERGVPSGLAFDQDGLPMACMGIAIGDANGDGRLDLFVTNFAGESNTLYLQRKDGLFDDATRQAGLRNGSFASLGFGTQFIDGELDGWPDLILTNGHVDDHSYRGDAYRMRPQYYRNIGGGRFVDVPAKTLGSFFARKYLGRGLARLDWNHDGREDIVISHLDSPTALLTNRTPRTGRALVVRLIGVRSNRDAIGTTVRVTAGSRTSTRQLTAGDGFQASNQRELVFGLSDAVRIERVQIRWPSGREQTFVDLPANRELIVIEGRPKPILRGLSEKIPNFLDKSRPIGHLGR